MGHCPVVRASDTVRWCVHGTLSSSVHIGHCLVVCAWDTWCVHGTLSGGVCMGHCPVVCAWDTVRWVGYNEVKHKCAHTAHKPGQFLKQEHWLHRVEEYAQTIGSVAHDGQHKHDGGEALHRAASTLCVCVGTCMCVCVCVGGGGGGSVSREL